MPGGNDIGRDEAMAVFLAYAPMFDGLEDRGIDYCVVGGLGVMIQGLAKDSGAFRATRDLDMVIARGASADSILESYRDTFADTDSSRETFDAVIVDYDYPSQIAAAIRQGDNITLEGFDEDEDGFWAPDIDLCQKLNGLSLADLDRERVNVLGHEVNVATVPQLIAMKEMTIGEYRVGNEPSPRMQDYIDLQRLKGLGERWHRPRDTPEGR